MIERSWVQVPAGAAGEFSSPGSSICADFQFCVRFTSGLPQQHVRDPGHSVQVQINTHEPYICAFE